MYYIGIDIGGTTIKAGIVSKYAEILGTGSIPTIADEKCDQIITGIVKLCSKLIHDSHLFVSDIYGIGIGIPGTIDEKSGTIVYSNNLAIENIPIVERLKKHTHIPVLIGNDANCAAVGERIFGNARGNDNIIFITLGTGIGTGIIQDGKLLTGRCGAGAEGGHMVISCDGERCTCGRKGCWEAYASATALIRMTKKAIEKNPNGKLAAVAKEEGKVSGRTAFKAEKIGDGDATNIVNDYIRYIAEGIINLINIFRPEKVLIGGGMSNEGDHFIERIERIVMKESYGGERNPRVIVTKAGLLNNAGILGAASLCIPSDIKRDEEF
ncbi:MAG: ROK family protein [Christensenellaceae bacterium]|nr:ROK family protein [Christensenellaceae bacterium]